MSSRVKILQQVLGQAHLLIPKQSTEHNISGNQWCQEEEVHPPTPPTTTAPLREPLNNTNQMVSRLDKFRTLSSIFKTRNSCLLQTRWVLLPATTAYRLNIITDHRTSKRFRGRNPVWWQMSINKTLSSRFSTGMLTLTRKICLNMKSQTLRLRLMIKTQTQQEWAWLLSENMATEE